MNPKGNAILIGLCVNGANRCVSRQSQSAKQDWCWYGDGPHSRSFAHASPFAFMFHNALLVQALFDKIDQ
jgi:hypothetical protein